jgi:preprotein translocase subunit SecB
MKKGIAVRAQYLKDLSFENPDSPFVFADKELNPKIDVSVDVSARGMQKTVFEVVLKINGTAKKVIEAEEDKQIFIAEVVYGGLFDLTGIDESEYEETLLIDCPAILFPFARRIMAEVSREGGFLPLMIDPIDFEALYERKKENK